MRPRLVALVLLVLLASCGGPERPAKVPTADVERLLVSTQKRKSPRLQVGAASCPEQVRLANGTNFTCTVQIEGVSAPYSVTLRDVGALGAPGSGWVEIGGRIGCTITLGDAVQKVTAEVKDLKGTVVVKG